MLRGIEEMEAELVAKGNAGNAGFSLCIAKISQGLQKFHNHSENFAIPAKFFYAHFFAMIAKFTMHSEICPLVFFIQTTSFCVIPILSLL